MSAGRPCRVIEGMLVESECSVGPARKEGEEWPLQAVKGAHHEGRIASRVPRVDAATRVVRQQPQRREGMATPAQGAAATAPFEAWRPLISTTE